MFPLRQRIISGYKFGQPTPDGPHKGTDYKANFESYKAPFNGKVIRSGIDPKGGLYQVFRPDAQPTVELKAFHLSQFKVTNNVPVKEGTEIAITGNSGGHSTGPHVHQEVWISGKNIDPETFNWETKPMVHYVKSDLPIKGLLDPLQSGQEIYILQLWANYDPQYVNTGGKHNGIDIAAPLGTPIYALMEGKVYWSGLDPAGSKGYGNVVYTWTEENGGITERIYAHMRDLPLVQAGQTVTKGQLIGYVGATGNAAMPHLHLTKKLKNKDGNLILNNGIGGSVDPIEEIFPGMVLVFKLVGDPTLYVAVGSKLVPFGNCWNEFVSEFPSHKLVELDVPQFTALQANISSLLKLDKR